MPRLDEVFCDSGFPKYNYVKPADYTGTKVAVQTPGKGLIIEGPSGIGKTTCLMKVMSDLKIGYKILSARKANDVKEIEHIMDNTEDHGYIIIDDFHKLPENLKNKLADLLKVLAEEREERLKIILIGINSAGSHLVHIADDLNDRIDTITVGNASIDKIMELLNKSEQVLNIKLNCKEELAKRCQGSFNIAQILGKELCIQSGISESKVGDTLEVTTSLEKAINTKMAQFDRVYKDKRLTFACGNRNRKSGKAPYLWILKKLSESESGLVDLKELSAANADYRASLRQLMDRDHINKLLDKHDNLRDVMYYDSETKILTIDQPKFFFYLKNTDWQKFAHDMGFRRLESPISYDVALSFAGDCRDFAKSINNILQEEEISVFYDENESAYILGKDVEKYLAPIYSSNSRYVVAIFNETYGQRVWPVFESSQYIEKYDKDEVIPITFPDYTPDPTSKIAKKGYFKYDSALSKEDNAINFCEKIKQKLDE